MLSGHLSEEINGGAANVPVPLPGLIPRERHEMGRHLPEQPVAPFQRAPLEQSAALPGSRGQLSHNACAKAKRSSGLRVSMPSCWRVGTIASLLYLFEPFFDDENLFCDFFTYFDSESHLF